MRKYQYLCTRYHNPTMTKQALSQRLKPGFIYLAITTLIFFVQLVCYIWGSPVTSAMDAAGWAFYLTSCLSHGACLAIILWAVLCLPLSLARLPRVGGWVMSVGAALVSVLLFLNMQVYDIYRFHINGFVLNLVFGGGGSEIFTFDTALYLREGLLLAIFVALAIGAWIASMKLSRLCTRAFVWTTIGVMLGCTLWAHGYHIYAAFMQKSSVLKSQRLIPYYFPTTANSLMERFGLTPPQGDAFADTPSTASGEVNYPLHPIVAEKPDHQPNILLILIDSWSRRALDPETMPNVWKYAGENHLYDNHFSCSNGTRGSVFGIYFSAPAYYWDLFESSKVNPVFIDTMLDEGYTCQVYPGATLVGPPFFRVVFRKIPNLNISTPGKTAWNRDRAITDNFIHDLHGYAESGKPFFSMVFYDLPHSFEITPEQIRFKPSWSFADYTKLNNDLDPTEFFNLYRNTCYETDKMIGDLLAALEKEGVADNTVVIITGDHAQEFNENRKNFWSHGGNFSHWQIQVPLIMHTPGEEGGKVSRHRTTHYDIVPTLMQRFLGVKNPADDYSAGHLLTDTTSRDWHVVGSELNYGFIVAGDTILEKTPTGGLEVTDAALNPVDDYRVDPAAFREAMTRLNRFMK